MKPEPTAAAASAISCWSPGVLAIRIVTHCFLALIPGRRPSGLVEAPIFSSVLSLR